MNIVVKNILNNQVETLELPEAVLTAVQEKQDDAGELYMAPGLFDLQVNGYSGVDFNDADLTVSKIEQAVEALLPDGVTRFLPTLITNDPEVVEHNLEVLHKAMAENPLTGSCIPGIHLEGPFLSGEEGYRGAHDRQWMRNPDRELFEKWQDISGNRIRLITLAPELEGSMEFIDHCTANNVKVAIGHSSAGPEIIREAASRGAILSTHLGNAIPRQVHRHNNVVIDHLAEENLHVSIIADGHHLPRNLIKVILKVKDDKVLLVSDSTKFSSMQPGVYKTVIGGKVELSSSRRLAVYGKEEYLAGAASSLFQCVEFMVREKLLSLPEAWKAASLAPARLMGQHPDAGEQVLFTLHRGKIEVLLTIKGPMYYF